MLQDVKEIFDFQHTVVHQIRAVNGVPDFVSAKVGSYGFWPDCSSQVRVMRTTEFSKRIHHIILADFKSNTRTSCQLFCQSCKLRHNTFIDFQELLSTRSVKPEHLHGADLESFG